MSRLYKAYYLHCFLLLMAGAPPIANARPSNPGSDSLTTSIVKDSDTKSLDDLVNLVYDYSIKDFHKAHAYSILALDKAKQQKRPQAVFDVQRAMGYNYEENNHLSEAYDYYLQALETARTLGPSNLLTIYNDLGIILKKLGRYKEAIDYYNKTLDLAQKTGDQEMVEDSYHGLGAVYSYAGDFDKAIQYYFLSLKVAESRNNTEGMIVTLQNMSNTFIRSNNNEKAQQYIKKAYQLAIDLKKPDILGSVLNIYGKVLSASGELDSALQRHQRALDIFTKLGDKADIVHSMINIADIYTQKKEYREAEKVFENTLQYSEFIINYDHATLYYKLGALYEQEHKNQEAEAYFKKGLELSSSLEYNELIQKCNFELYKIYRADNQYERALQCLEISHSLGDSLFNQEKSKRIAELKFKYDVEKGEKEIQALQFRENKLLLISISIVFALLLVFLTIVAHLRGRNNRALKQKHEEIQIQNKKLEESNAVLRQFAYAAAHDLKEPLRTIGSFITLIQRRFNGQVSGDLGEYMTFVTKGVQRMNNLLTDLLEYSTVIAQQPGHELIDLKDVIQDVKDNLQSTIESKHAVIEYSKHLPSLRMNRLHLTQLFQNLISNSLKFSETDPIVKINGEQSNGRILITIQDNGIGINQEFGEKVFNLFHQLQRHRYEGTGIGLTICKNIVDKYDGKIWFESKENEGTRFYISLPGDEISSEN